MARLVGGGDRQRRRHLVVQAGTGTGKTLAYLVPPSLSARPGRGGHGDQGVAGPAGRKDLPFLAYPAAPDAVRLRRPQGTQQLRLPPAAAGGPGRWRRRPARAGRDGPPAPGRRSAASPSWAGSSDSGDAAELDWSPSDVARRSVSVGSDECPGRRSLSARRSVLRRTAGDGGIAGTVYVTHGHGECPLSSRLRTPAGGAPVSAWVGKSQPTHLEAVSRTRRLGSTATGRLGTFPPCLAWCRNVR